MGVAARSAGYSELAAAAGFFVLPLDESRRVDVVFFAAFFRSR